MRPTIPFILLMISSIAFTTTAQDEDETEAKKREAAAKAGEPYESGKSFKGESRKIADLTATTVKVDAKDAHPEWPVCTYEFCSSFGINGRLVQRLLFHAPLHGFRGLSESGPEVGTNTAQKQIPKRSAV